MKRLEGTFASKTDPGRVRLSNEDQTVALTNAYGEVLLVVCDGMGGQNKGDYASRLAMNSIVDAFHAKKTLPSFLTRMWVAKAVKEANRVIFDMASSQPAYEGMGTTLVLVLLSNGKMYLVNAGDSRAYAFKDNELRCLTEDQTYVDYLVRTGQIEERERSSRSDRHVLMNALGIFPSASFDLTVRPYSGETILLCSDGLYNNISDTEIRAILRTDDRTDEKASALLATANGNGGSDNIAVSLWEALPE